MPDTTAVAAPTALQRLIDEPKGKCTYTSGEGFLLHVFWEAPNETLALQLLQALSQCAHATHRDTPCVPTYFFRISSNDEGMYGPAPHLVSEYKPLASAIKKLRVGIAKSIVSKDLEKRGIDPSYLDYELTAELPPSLQGQTPIAVEFTELYLDERAFMEHAGSKDYLQGYGAVMNPALIQSTPITLRFGTPTQNMIEKILDPMLREQPVVLSSPFCVWNDKAGSMIQESSFFLSLDLSAPPSILSDSLKECSVWRVCFQHPVRPVVRFMIVFACLPSESIFQELASMAPSKGEAHTQGEISTLRDAFSQVGLSFVTINDKKSVGYFLHKKISELQPITQS